MFQSIPHRLIRQAIRAARLVLAVLGATLIMPAVAEATCGDYLVHRTSAEESMETSAPLVRKSHSTLAVPRHPTPCDGPACSNGTTPPVVPVSVVPPMPNDWAHLEGSRIFQAPTWEKVLWRLSLALPDPPATRIERPPQMLRGIAFSF